MLCFQSLLMLSFVFETLEKLTDPLCNRHAGLTNTKHVLTQGVEYQEWMGQLADPSKPTETLWASSRKGLVGSSWIFWINCSKTGFQKHSRWIGSLEARSSNESMLTHTFQVMRKNKILVLFALYVWMRLSIVFSWQKQVILCRSTLGMCRPDDQNTVK